MAIYHAVQDYRGPERLNTHYAYNNTIMHGFYAGLLWGWAPRPPTCSSASLSRCRVSSASPTSPATPSHLPSVPLPPVLPYLSSLPYSPAPLRYLTFGGLLTWGGGGGTLHLLCSTAGCQEGKKLPSPCFALLYCKLAIIIRSSVINIP